ncbi:MAG: hypothetical protein ACO1ON_13150 [Nocardioides sp.]
MAPDVVTLIITAIVSLIGGGTVGVVVTAVLQHRRGTRGDLMTAMSARLAEVEADLREQREWRRGQEERYSRLWSYCRSLIDYAYRHSRDGSPAIPDMPEGLS